MRKNNNSCMNQKITLLLMLILGVIIAGCAQEAQMLQIKYQPKQCETLPWDQWYQEGGIEFVMKPTEEQLAIAYYSHLDTPIENFTKIETDQATCEACEVCDTSYYYTAKSNPENKEALQKLGWTIN